jgi:beta-lactamase regulating signal transducer with metallopeptidase domain
MNVIDDLFSWFVAASGRGTILALVVLLMRLVLWKRLSPVARYALWLPSVVVLCAPWLPASRLSAERWFAARTAPPRVQTVIDRNMAAGGSDTVEPVSQPVPVEAANEQNWWKTAAVTG